MDKPYLSHSKLIADAHVAACDESLNWTGHSTQNIDRHVENYVCRQTKEWRRIDDNFDVRTEIYRWRQIRTTTRPKLELSRKRDQSISKKINTWKISFWCTILRIDRNKINQKAVRWGNLENGKLCVTSSAVVAAITSRICYVLIFPSR